MGNCLKTQLKESVSGDLPILGTICFNLCTLNGVLNVQFVGLTQARLTGNAVFSNSSGTTEFGKTSTLSSSYIKNPANGDMLYVKDKENLTKILIAETPASRVLKENSGINLDYCSSLTEMNISKYNTNVSFDLNKFSKTNHVLTKLRYHNNNKIVGDVETIVENMIAGGREFGNTLQIQAVRSSIRLNNNIFMISPLEAILITFTAANNVTVNVGEQGTGALLASWDGSTWTYA